MYRSYHIHTNIGTMDGMVRCDPVYFCGILESLHAFAWSHLLGKNQMKGWKILVKAAVWHDSWHPIYPMCKHWMCV